MITKRIIPCLDVKDGRVVKGVNFLGLADVSSPVKLAKFYSGCGADELVFYDITASAEGRALFTDILTEVASTIFIPLTVGGGINTVDDFDRVLKCGADKVSVNSGAIADPGLIAAAAKRYGDQCVVLSMDVKRVDGRFRLFAKGGREDTGIDAMEWAVRGAAGGAGAADGTAGAEGSDDEGVGAAGAGHDAAGAGGAPSALAATGALSLRAGSSLAAPDLPPWLAIPAATGAPDGSMASLGELPLLYGLSLERLFADPSAGGAGVDMADLLPQAPGSGFAVPTGLLRVTFTVDATRYA